MSLKGTLRSLQAAQRRAERNARRQQRELANQQKQLAKMEALERATYEVQVHENYLDLLLSIHKECGPRWNWQAIQASKQPLTPVKSNSLELAAKAQLDAYKPSTIDKLLRRSTNKQQELLAAVEKAKQVDKRKYKEALENHEVKLTEWQETTQLANKILADDPESHLAAIEQVKPFHEINQIGSSMQFHFHGNLIEAIIHVNSDDIIPSESKTLLKSGKVSTKKMSKSRFYELYQDYICGAVLRVGRELFALLPIKMVLVTAVGSVLNTKTGYMENQPILSVAMPSTTLLSLNFDLLDPSDSMANFVHRMNFKKTKGFTKIVPIQVNELLQG